MQDIVVLKNEENDTKRKKSLVFSKLSATITINDTMTAMQRKIYNGLLYRANEDIKEDKNAERFEISLSELKGYFDIDTATDKNNKWLKKLLLALHSISFEFNILHKDHLIWGASNLINDPEINHDKKTNAVIISYSLPRRVRISMVNKTGLYAKIDLMIIKGLLNKYALILYEICRDYKNVEIPMMTMEEFRKVFGLLYEKNGETQEKYKNMNNLRKWVLEPACTEINNNKNIPFTVIYQLSRKRGGNYYTHIKFYMKGKKIKQQLLQQGEKQQILLLMSMIPEQNRTKLIEKILFKALKERGVTYAIKQIECVNSSRNIKNFAAYLKAALKDDFANTTPGELSAEVAVKETEIIKKKSEAEDKRVEKYIAEMPEEERAQLKAGILADLHAKYPDKRKNSILFGELTIHIGLKKIVHDRIFKEKLYVSSRGERRRK